MAQYQDDISIENKTLGFLVTIIHGKGRTMFRCNSIRELWKEIKHYSRIYK